MPSPRKVPEEIEKTLAHKYENGERLSTLGDPFGYDYKTVRRVLVESGVKIRNTGGTKLPPIAHVSDLIAWLRAGESCRQIALRLNTYPNKIANTLRDAGYEPEDGRHRRGTASPLTKNPRRVSKEGYVTVLLDPHEYKFQGLRTSRNTMLEHRLVMARSMGRALYDHENVHHRNGDRADNRLKNLELWERGQPPGQRSTEAPPRKHCPTCTCCT